MRHWNFRRILAAGLLVTLPGVITAYVLWVVFNYLDGILQPWITQQLGFKIPGVGILALLLLIMLVGLFASNFLGARIVSTITARLERIPLWSPVYRSVRDISEVILGDSATSFRRVALMAWPRPGVYAMVFVTSEGQTPASQVLGKDMVSVLLPTTPNPTSGFYMMVPRDELIYLDLGVEQALKVIISGGAAFDPGTLKAEQSSSSDAETSTEAE